uniref:CHK kinase-like domain-containing protein n=1 Tax=Anopheles christyi TaxID=43041 RepID=A0A182K9B1_9DIPT
MVLESDEQAIDQVNHVTQPSVSEVPNDATADGARTRPAFVYTAMDQVAQQEGFTVGQYTIETADGSSKGDGFMGELFCAYLIEGARREVYLCKIPPQNEARRQQFGTMESFDREVLVYNKFLPLMFAYQQEMGISREDGFYCTPKCYYAHYDGQAAEAIIVMEDLRLNNYHMFAKDKPVDYEHARLTVEQLGRYNAVSLAMKHDRPDVFEQFKVLDPMKEMMGPGSPFIMMLQKTTLDAMETLEPHETKEQNKMQKLLEGIPNDVDRYANFALAEPYAKGAPEQVVLYDWQSARYCSPILDLAYFIICCTHEDLRQRHYDELVNVYYNSLATLLEKLGHSSQEVFPRTAFLRQLRQYGRFGLMLAMFVVAMLCTRNEDLPDMDETAEMFRETDNVDIAIYTKCIAQIRALTMTGESNTEAGVEQPPGVSSDQQPTVKSETEAPVEQTSAAVVDTSEKVMEEIKPEQQQNTVQDDLRQESDERVVKVVEDEKLEESSMVEQLVTEEPRNNLQEESEEKVVEVVEEEQLKESSTVEPRNEAPTSDVPVKEETLAEAAAVVAEPEQVTVNEPEHSVTTEETNSEPVPSSLLNGEADVTVPVASEESSSAPATAELPRYLYNAMEQVAIEQGFTAGQYKIEFDVGSNKGDGFVGQMFKAFLTEGERREVYLCKIPPLNEARRQQFETMTIFSRETLAYKSLLPLILAYQEEKGISREDGFFNVPKCFYAECNEATEESVIVMEDLRLKDYRMWDKLVPVNYEHARLTMQQLGRLHAVSLALKRDRPADFEQFKVPDPLDVMMPQDGPFEAMMLKMLSDAMETLEPHETKERAKMQKLVENMRQEMKSCTDSTLAEPYAVLGHGDCWVNNFMFHYTNGAPEHVVLLDWQITRYVSPVTDLAYFIFCCTDEEFRRRHFDEMMSIYYNSLATLLEKLGHNPQEVFPRTALMRQLRRFGRFGIFMAIFLVPMLCTRNEDLPDMDEAAEKYRETKEMDLAAIAMNANQMAYRKRMSAVIRDMVRYGYL